MAATEISALRLSRTFARERRRRGRDVGREGKSFRILFLNKELNETCFNVLLRAPKKATKKNGHVPRPSNRCFLEAFKHRKTTRKTPHLQGAGMFLLVVFGVGFRVFFLKSAWAA